MPDPLLIIGFESLNATNLIQSNKRQNLGRDYERVIQRLHDLGIMINGSFVFGLDGDSRTVFAETVEWAVNMGITTATFHIATPYRLRRLLASGQSPQRLTLKAAFLQLRLPRISSSTSYARGSGMAGRESFFQAMAVHLIGMRNRGHSARIHPLPTTPRPPAWAGEFRTVGAWEAEQRGLLVRAELITCPAGWFTRSGNAPISSETSPDVSPACGNPVARRR